MLLSSNSQPKKTGVFMSHIVSVQTRMRDPAALAAACTRLGLPEPHTGTAALFSSQASGWIVTLPGWNYPVVFEPTTGEARFDNFQGRWGEQKELDRLLQAYAIEKVRLEARRSGQQVLEQPQADGSVKLIVRAGGAGGAR
jgi:hypothetical protein